MERQTLFAQQLCKPIIVVALDAQPLPDTLPVSPLYLQGGCTNALPLILPHLPKAKASSPLQRVAKQAAHAYIRERKAAIDLAEDILKRGTAATGPCRDSRHTRDFSGGAQLVELFSEMRKKQLDFLDESGKSLIERIATFLTVLFGVTAFSGTFPPPYLKGNMPAKILVVVILILYLLSLACAVLAIQPRLYDVPIYNVTRMGDLLKKLRALRCGICGSRVYSLR